MRKPSTPETQLSASTISGSSTRKSARRRGLGGHAEDDGEEGGGEREGGSYQASFAAGSGVAQQRAKPK